MPSDTTARPLYDQAIVIDGLNVSSWDSPAVFRSLHAGGVTAINATIVTWENYPETMDTIAAWLRRFGDARSAQSGESQGGALPARHDYDDVLTQVKTVADIRQAKQDGNVGIILGFQNATPIENDLDRLAVFHALGVRIIQVTFHERNLLGNGCYEPRDDGLSHFGVDAVREMNRLGILVDLSHCGNRTTLDAIEQSARPVACTHANARSYFDVPRNKTDEALKLMAERGGVVGATAIAGFLRTGWKSTLDDYVDAIDHLVEMLGIDHVAIGTDFTQDQPVSFWRYISSQQGTKYPSVWANTTRRPEVNQPGLYPRDLETPDKLPNLAAALLRRGYGPADTAKLLGENWLRLFEAVWSD